MEAVSFTTCAHCRAPTSQSLFCCDGCKLLHSAQFNSGDLSVNAAYAYLDEPHFKDKYYTPHGVFHYQLYVAGLHCASCIHLLEKIPEFDSSVQEARIDYNRSRLALRVRPDFSLARIATLLHSWGYEPHFLATGEASDELFQKERRSSLKKIGVTAACAGNIMLFVIPVYSGLEGPLRTAFNYMSCLLFLPVLLYSGTSFYKGAWNSLRYRTINVDLPITVALISGFILSTVNLLRGEGAIYYDSTASFIFLILCARYFLKNSQHQFLHTLRIQDILKTDTFLKWDEDHTTRVSLEDIRANDILILKYGQISPVDARVQDKSALFDVAVLNGEPTPRRFEPGMTVLAGSKYLGAEIALQVIHPPAQTALAALLAELQNGTWQKVRFIAFTDRCAQGLIVTVFTAAVVFFVMYFQYDPQEAFNRALALIVLACPCALAFGAPLALNLALREAQTRGILIKNGDCFENLLQLKNIFFDKTGTLTDLELQLISTEPAIISNETKSLILGLESASYHPIAFALRNAWPKIAATPFDSLHEDLGRGVRGTFGTRSFTLEQEATAKQGLTIVLKENGQFVCRLSFASPLYSEAPGIIRKLQARGLHCFLISGDASSDVQDVATSCGLDPASTFRGVSPEQKRALIQAENKTCMVGDGTNDALALKQANIGIAMKGSSYLSLQAADIYFTRAGLQPLLDLFQLADKTKRVLFQTLALSLTYNLIGGGLALSGYVTPWLAAILMPTSSFLIITTTLWGFR